MNSAFVKDGLCTMVLEGYEDITIVILKAYKDCTKNCWFYIIDKVQRAR